MSMPNLQDPEIPAALERGSILNFCKALAEREEAEEEELFLEPDEAPPPPPVLEAHSRHPLSHLDFYCFFISAALMMATTTSLIDQWALEPLIFSAIGFTWVGLVFNLTRDRQHFLVTRRPLVIRFVFTGWEWLGFRGMRFSREETLAEIQARHLRRYD